MKSLRGFVGAVARGLLAGLVIVAPVEAAITEYYDQAEWEAALAGIVLENLNSLTDELVADYTLSSVPYVVGTHSFTAVSSGPSLRRSGSVFDGTAWLGWSGSGGSVRYTRVTVPASFGVAINYYGPDNGSNDSDGRPHNSFYFRNVNGASGTWSALVNDTDENRPGRGFYGIVDDQGGITSYEIGTTWTNHQSYGADNFRYATSLAAPAAQVWYGDGLLPGSDGDWTTAGNNWRSGTANIPFVATALATFPSPGGTVAIQPAGMAANGGLRFEALTEYSLTGGRLTLGGADLATNTVLVEPFATATFSAPVTALNGLTKSGLGELVLGGPGSVLGPVVVSDGTLTIAATHTYTEPVAIDEARGLLAFGPSGTIACAAVISGGPVSHTGFGTTYLTGANTYTGVTTLNAGAHVLASAGALPGGIGTTGGTSALVFDGGILGLGAGNFTRSLGAAWETTAANFTGAGGWAAYGADRTVNVGGAGATIEWGAADTGFNGQTLFLGASSATHTVDLVNPLDLGLDIRTVSSGDGDARYDGRISGVIGGETAEGLPHGGLTKTGAGTLELTATNTYAGATTVSAGVLVAGAAGALPGGIGTTGGTSALVFDGGVLGLGAGNYARSLAAAGTVDAANFTGAGGWAAYGADRTVNVGGAGATIEWGAADTGFNGQTLFLGASSATHTVDLVNPLDLGMDIRTVSSGDGAAGVDGRISGTIAGGVGGGLTKTGAGTLELAGSNSFSGPTTVAAGTLRVGHAQALGSSVVTVAGGTLATSLTTALTGLNVENGQVLLDSAETHALEVGSFAIDLGAGGLVDLGVGRLEIAAGADGAALREALAAGGAVTGWNGTAGIVSTAAAAAGGARTVGYLLGSGGSAVLAFAAPGDTNLDGLVDTLDLVTMASSGKYGTGQAAVWADGDFNYDGVVDSLDLVTMASLGIYGTGNYLPLPTAPVVTAVPEPGSVALVLFALAGGAGLTARRRRSFSKGVPLVGAAGRP